jgi:hypothetical protein
VLSSISLRSTALCKGLGLTCFIYFFCLMRSVRLAFKIGLYRSFKRRWVWLIVPGVLGTRDNSWDFWTTILSGFEDLDGVSIGARGTG